MRIAKKLLAGLAGGAMLAMTLGVGSLASAASNYYDISTLTPLAQTAINGLYGAHIMNGTAPGKFSPAGVVTRAQAVKFVVNLIGVELSYPKTPTYSDVSKGSQYYPYIETALADGLLSNYAGTSGDFNPSTPVTRIQLAILIVNALGDQSLAQSLSSDSQYAHLGGYAQIPAGDAGYANAGMKLGFVPPLDATSYAPNAKVDREQLAVGLWRAHESLESAAPASVTATTSAATVGVNQADVITASVLGKSGTALTQAELGGYTIAYSVTGTNASTASVSAAGTFVATAAGDYTVEVSVSGGSLTAPLTTTVSIGVYGAATAIVLKAASPTVPADGSSTDTITVNVVDANGNLVADYNGVLDVTDDAELIADAQAAGLEPSDFTSGAPDTVAISNGTGTFVVGHTTVSGVTDAIVVTAPGTDLNAGTATISTVVPSAAKIGLAIESGQPASLSANTQTVTDLVVSFEDASGNEIATGIGEYVTLTLTGPGSFTSGGTAVTTMTDYVNGTAVVPVYSMAGLPGSIVVTATGADLEAGEATIPTYINTAPAGLSVTQTTGTDVNGNVYTEYTVTVTDTNGHPISSATGEISVTSNASVGGGELYFGTVSSANVFTGSAEASTDVAVTNGVATFAVETDTVGTGTVTLTLEGASGSASGLSTTTTYTYAAGVPTRVGLTPNGIDVAEYNVVGGTSMTITAQAEDTAGSPVDEAGEAVTFEFIAPTTGVNFPNGLSTGTYTVETNADGVAVLTLALPNPVTEQSFRLDAALGSSINGTITETPAINIYPTDNTSQITTHLVPSTTGYPTAGTELQAGSVLNGLTVTAENEVGAGVGGDTLSITSSDTNVIANPGADIVTDSAGVATIPSMVAGMAGTTILTITDLSDANAPSTSIAITVSPGSTATQSVIEYNGAPISANNPLTVQADIPVELSLVNADAEGDPLPVTGTTAETFALSVGAGVTGGYLDASGGAPISNASISPGSTSVTIWFESTTSEVLDAATDLIATGTTLHFQGALSYPQVAANGTSTPTVPPVVNQYGTTMATTGSYAINAPTTSGVTINAQTGVVSVGSAPTTGPYTVTYTSDGLTTTATVTVT